MPTSAARAGDPAPHRFLFFSGTESWRDGSYLYGGMYWAPAGIERDGFIAKLYFDTGRYRFESGTFGGMVTGKEYVAQFLPGWRFKWGTTEFKLFAGLDTQRHNLSPDDPGASLRGTQTGARVAFEIWSEPTPRSMIALAGGGSTVGRGFDFYAATGLKLGRFYVGPEAQMNFSGDYREYRGGVHLTAVPIGPIECGFGIGYAGNTDGRHGPYGRLSAAIKR